MRPHLLLACVLLAVTSITSEVVFAQTNCPSSCLRFVDHPEVCSSRAAVDSIYSQCASGGCGGGHVKYELASGEVAANAAGEQFSAEVRAVDDYRVVGLPAGQPLTFEARLDVDGYNARQPDVPFGGGFFTVEIREGVANAQATSHGDGTWKETLAIPITVSAGIWFRIACRIDVGASRGVAVAEGQLSFIGLPPGASVVSCQGFRDDVPVALVPSSWGRVKSRYR